MRSQFLASFMFLLAFAPAAQADTGSATASGTPSGTSATEQTPPAAAAAPAATAEVPPPFHIAGKTSRAIQKYTGLTWLAQSSLNLGGTVAAKCILHGHPKVRFQAYSLTDCLSGKFKSVKLDLKDCSYKKVALGDLNVETSTPLQLRLFNTKKGAPGVAAPVMVAVSGKVDEKDVSKALQSPEISSQLNFLRLQLPGLGDQHLQVVEPKVKIENGQVKINTWLITAGAPKETGVSVDISAKPILEKERFISLQDTQVDSKDINDPQEFSKFSQELLNPLLDFGKFDRKTHAFRLTKLEMGEQNVQFAGKLLLVPKQVPVENKPARVSEK